MTDTADQLKALVLDAFDTLFNKRDYAAAERFWSPNYIRHSAHIEPGREGLFELVKASPPEMRYENALIAANGDYVILHGRFTNIGQPANWIAADIVRIEDGLLAEHWHVIQDEATRKNPRAGCRCSKTNSLSSKPRSATQGMMHHDQPRTRLLLLKHPSRNARSCLLDHTASSVRVLSTPSQRTRNGGSPRLRVDPHRPTGRSPHPLTSGSI